MPVLPGMSPYNIGNTGDPALGSSGRNSSQYMLKNGASQLYFRPWHHTLSPAPFFPKAMADDESASREFLDEPPEGTASLDLLSTKSLLVSKMRITKKRVKNPDERTFCMHCDQMLTFKTYRRHRQLYYNSESGDWIKSDKYHNRLR